MGPVIGRGAVRRRSSSTSRRAASEGPRRRRRADRAGDDGYFVEPTVFADVTPTARIAQEEIFGPVLAVIRAQDCDDALAHRQRHRVRPDRRRLQRSDAGAARGRAKRRFFVGNLYLNRKCTGALVGAHPFGGFNMSGTDSKAGGRDYLGLFLQQKSIATRKV